MVGARCNTVKLAGYRTAHPNVILRSKATKNLATLPTERCFAALSMTPVKRQIEA